MVWLRLIRWVFRRGLLWGTIEGALIGTVLLPLVGWLFGIPIGAFIGSVVGFINGLILTGVIRLKYHNRQDNQINGVVIYIVAIFVNIVFTFLALIILWFVTVANPIISLTNLAILSIPAWVEGANAAYFSKPFVNFATTELSKLSSRNSPANMLS